VNWLTILAMYALTAGGLPPSDQEHQIKTAFIYNFAKYITWPTLSSAQPDSPFKVGAYHANAFGSTLKTGLAGKAVEGHSITIEEVASQSSFRRYRIIVTDESDPDTIRSMAKDCKGTGAVLVGEAPNFAKYGGMIGFVTEDHVRFEINLASAQAAGVTISSKLLALARKVYR
jgi:hypothetical protein